MHASSGGCTPAGQLQARTGQVVQDAVQAVDGHVGHAVAVAPHRVRDRAALLRHRLVRGAARDDRHRACSGATDTSDRAAAVAPHRARDRAPPQPPRLRCRSRRPPPCLFRRNGDVGHTVVAAPHRVCNCAALLRRRLVRGAARNDRHRACSGATPVSPGVPTSVAPCVRYLPP